MLCSPIIRTVFLGVILFFGDSLFAQEHNNYIAENNSANEDFETSIAKAIASMKGGENISGGFEVLRRLDYRGQCPSQLLALVHSEHAEVVWRLRDLILEKKLAINGKCLTAEYDKAQGGEEWVLNGRSYGLHFDECGRRTRQAICAFAAYQTGRIPPGTFSPGGGKVTLPKPKPLDKETLDLLARALTDDDPAVRVAAADSIRLARICDDRFVKPLIQNIRDENTVVSDAASLAAAELNIQQAAPVIFQRLKSCVINTDSDFTSVDNQADLKKCGLPASPEDSLHLWGAYYSPSFCGGGWVSALGMLRHRPALALLRELSSPLKVTGDLKQYMTGGECKIDISVDLLVEAIVNIENKPHRPLALVGLAKDKTLAGNVRAESLRALLKDTNSGLFFSPENGSPFFKPTFLQYYEPRIFRAIVDLVDDNAPASHHGSDKSCLGRLAIEVAATKFHLLLNYQQFRSRKVDIRFPNDQSVVNSRTTNVEVINSYSTELLPVYKSFREKLESLLPGKDGALALEALAIAYPDWTSIDKCMEIVTDQKRQPALRVVAANILTSQPFFLEMDCNGNGKNAPPETVIKILPILSLHKEFDEYNWRYKETVTGVFRDLLGWPGSQLTTEQKAARECLLPILQKMKNGPDKTAIEDVISKVYEITPIEDK
ncbi:MAG: HEAT repeat domain-containing protein [Pirellulales bacterium]|nr:HEAT repeat domain-containing protein [Pirellulales bacterium]